MICFRLFVVVLLVLAPISCERLSDQIYLQLSGGRFNCFRILNSTHQAGCESLEEGNEGVVVYMENADALIDFVTFYSSLKTVIAVIDIAWLNKQTVIALQDNRISGVLLIKETSDEELSFVFNYSEDAACPNQEYSLYKECRNKWNEKGAAITTGLRFVDWKKPIFIIENSTEIDIIKNHCYSAYNKENLRGSVLCSARMKYFMRAAGNAEICLRRQQFFHGFADSSIDLCDPLEDINIYATIPALGKKSDHKILLLAARMDSFSSFTQGGIGEVSAVTSLITLLTVAKAFGKHQNDIEAYAKSTKKALMFAFFHGESLGYIGSSAAVNDIIKGKFPLDIKLTNIDTFIEVQQIDGSSTSFRAYVDPTSYNAPGNKHKIGNILAAANEHREKRDYNNSDMDEEIVKLADYTDSAQLPPSSYQMFLKKNRSLAGFVLAPFGNVYNYRHINSIGDRAVFKHGTKRVEKQIVVAARLLISSVLEFFEIRGLSQSYDVDKDYVAKLVGCFLIEPNWVSCNFIRNITQDDKAFENRVKETYISTEDSPSIIRMLINVLIINSLGSKSAENVPDKSQCEDLNKHQKVYRYKWQYDPDEQKFICYRSTVYMSVAKSPAFGSDGYRVLSTEYSTWVESVWSPKELKLFLTVHPYPMRDILILISGLLFLLICFIFMEFIYLGNKDAIDPPVLPPEVSSGAAPL